MFQALWEYTVDVFAFAVFIPVIMHPVETIAVVCTMAAVAIWRA